MTQVQKQDLTRLTVNLVPRAYKSMMLAVEITGDSRTDTINRALQFYAFAEVIMSNGGQILTRNSDGELAEIKFL